MKKLLLAICCLICVSGNMHAQIVYGLSTISVTPINFANDSTGMFMQDTATLPLWEYGSTHKSFFATDTTVASGIMTDTVNAYPVNANNSFVLKLSTFMGGINPIINFWHRYQTTSQHDGGIVEFSTDNGTTWQNVKGDCNVDGMGGIGVHTANFYAATDTLLTGEQAFSGVADSSVYSQFQIFYAIPIRTTGGAGCDLGSADSIFFRFRFKSDSTADSLAGWIIDSMQIEYDNFGGGVANVNNNKSLNVFPNPSSEGIYTFPALANEQQYNVEVYDAMGSKVIILPYKHTLNLSKYARGIYFYKVTNGTQYYSGRLLFD